MHPTAQFVEKPMQDSHKIGRGGVHVASAADFYGGKSHFPEEKSQPCRFCARKSEGFQQNLVGVAVAGELAPPSTCLSKYFLTDRAAGTHAPDRIMLWFILLRSILPLQALPPAAK